MFSQNYFEFEGTFQYVANKASANQCTTIATKLTASTDEV